MSFLGGSTPNNDRKPTSSSADRTFGRNSPMLIARSPSGAETVVRILSYSDASTSAAAGVISSMVAKST
jgi:hypothetical protein